MNLRVRQALVSLTRRLGFRAAVFSVGAVVAALLARQMDGYLPSDTPFDVSVDAIASILGALASSLLAVTIFSLSTLVSALAAATSRATPRARQLLEADHTALNALSTFLGAFLFSLVGLIVLRTGYYGDRGRLVLFIATCVVVVIVALTLLRWIHRISSLGGLLETTSLVESATAKALQARAEAPFLGGRPMPASGVPAGAAPLTLGSTGYLQDVDMARLQAVADEIDGRVYLDRVPGAFVTPVRPVAHVVAPHLDPADVERLRKAFAVNEARTFEHDPRFGLLVLSEIAVRALSPAVNDPGTAIDVIGRCVRLLLVYRPAVDAQPSCDRVHAPSLDPHDLVDDAFGGIAHYGAGDANVGVRLQKALAALAYEGDPSLAQPAVALAALARSAARDALTLDRDIERVASAFEASLPMPRNAQPR